MKFFASLFLLVISDLVTKYFAHFWLKEQIFLIGNFLSLELSKNQGVAFSFPLKGVLLKLITLTLIFGIIYYYFKEERKKHNIYVDIAFILIIAGAIGNGIERIFLGQVTDFISVQSFAIFNFADAYITIGGALFIWSMMRKK